jgi:hypothetical protein
MTGARLETPSPQPMFEDVRPNVALAGAARANAEAIGMRVDPPMLGRRGSGASTDFGNVSHVMPAFAMRFAISPEPVPGQRHRHSKGFGHYRLRPAGGPRPDRGGTGRVRRPRRVTEAPDTATREEVSWPHETYPGPGWMTRS